MTRQSIFAEIEAERTQQDALWGGAEHDARHSASDWVAIMVRHLGLAVDDGHPASITDARSADGNPSRYRRQLVRVAAVAVAALEALERKARSSPNTPAWVQQLADSAGQTVLLLPFRLPDPGQNTPGQNTPYAVLKSLADDWELEHAIAQVEPRESEQQ